jgi:NAD(P)-dependent dehydrogenase (short-subunit alcohol dehydrogenase family)
VFLAGKRCYHNKNNQLKGIMANNKTVVITGCSTGIGHCVALGLQQKGYRVFATARQKQDVAQLSALGLDSVQLDLADSASIQTAVADILNRSDGKIYALFNNGAYGQAGAVEDLNRDVLRAQFETNLFGWLELTNLILPVMRQQGYGRIIQNGSLLGFVCLRYRGAYNASKHALEGLSDTLRLELAGTHIYVSLIEPGPIESKFRQNSLQLFQKNINIDNSVHKTTYLRQIQRLAKQGHAAPFTLPAEAVLAQVLRALESPKPKARYYVTFPSHLFAWLKRLLPTSWLDYILLRVD